MKAKRKSRIETELKILNAGLQVFSDLGFESSSLKEIAGRAGINEALIIRYYGSKSKLLTALITEYSRIQEEAALDIPEFKTVDEEIKEFLLRETRSDFKHREFIRITIAQLSLDPELRRQQKNLISAGENKVLRKRLLKFQSQGEIEAGMSVETIAYGLQVQALGFGLLISMQPRLNQKTIEKQAEQIAQIFANGIRSKSVIKIKGKKAGTGIE